LCRFFTPAKKKWTDRNGITRCYSFISFGDFQGPACRVAWLLGHGEWRELLDGVIGRDSAKCKTRLDASE
jgi:hypothetical protein